MEESNHAKNAPSDESSFAEPPFVPVDRKTWNELKDGLPSSLFAKNRARFLALAREVLKPAKGDFALFKGASEVPIYSSDICYPEYQEAFFYYLFGAKEMDTYGLIDLENGKTVLFVPHLDNLYKIWMNFRTPDEMAATYGIEVRYVEDLEMALSEFDGTCFVNQGVNSDSGLTSQIPEESYLTPSKGSNYKVDRHRLHDVLAEARVIKNDEEVLALRWASQITAEAHCNVMKNVRAGMRESQIESFFNFHGQQKYFTGRVAPYLSICGCGPTAATLHYHDNDKTLRSGQTMLTDQGHSFHHYGSDVTISFPVDGRFTARQAAIYDIVLRSSRAVFAALKPGVSWLDMHKLAERIVLSGLINLGCIKGDIDDLIEKRIGFIFMPHGLGHLLGLDIHDVGGYLENSPARESAPGLKNLRTARVMEEGMVVTIEPGCYFRDFLLEGSLPSSFYEFDLSCLDLEKIREYQAEVAGVRIEDVVLLTKDGCENLSWDLPRSVEAIEKCMAGQEWRSPSQPNNTAEE